MQKTKKSERELDIVLVEGHQTNISLKNKISYIYNVVEEQNTEQRCFDSLCGVEQSSRKREKMNERTDKFYDFFFILKKKHRINIHNRKIIRNVYTYI